MRKNPGFVKLSLLLAVLTALAGCAALVKSSSAPLVECTGEGAYFNQNTIIVVAMHGIPPIGSGPVVSEFMMLEAIASAQGDKTDPKRLSRLEELGEKLTNWPLRENRPYQAGAEKLGRLLSEKTGTKVLVGYNEFCAPSLKKRLEEAAAEKPKRIMVVTTLTAPGNDHASNPEGDIFGTVLEAQKKFPDIEISYAWPYRFERLAKLLYDQLLTFTTLEELADPGVRVVIACHGTPPLEAPTDLIMEYMMLHGTSRAKGSERDKRHDELQKKVLSFPRNDEDAYWAGTQKLGKMLGKMIGSDVTVAYNEFCAPSLPAAFAEAVDDKAKKVIVISPMFEPDNPHAKRDVRQKVYRANKKNPDVEIRFAWPYPYDRVVSCLCGQLLEFRDKPGFSVK